MKTRAKNVPKLENIAEINNSDDSQSDEDEIAPPNTNIKPEKLPKDIKMKRINTLTCIFCDIKFETKNELSVHYRKHLEDRICHYCISLVDLKPRRKNELRLFPLHTISDGNLRIDRHLETIKSYRSHITSHKKIGKYLCKTCGKTFRHPGSVTVHERVHTGERPFKCSKCDKSFTYSCVLKMHMNTHSKEKRHMCNICDKKYRRDSELQLHIKVKHIMAVDDRPCVCECGQSFKTQQRLSRHKTVVHTTKRNYICKWCGMAFKANNSLYEHVKIHKRDKLFTCAICERQFLHKTVLKTHMKVHSRRK